MRILLLLVSFYLISLSVYSQVDHLTNYLKEARTGSYAAAPQELFADGNDFQELLTALIPYQQDSLVVIRSKAYSLSKRFGQLAESDVTKQLAISQQINALEDSDRGIVANAIEALKGFENTLFTETHKNKIAALLNPNFPHFNDFVKLIGFLQIQSSVPLLKDMLYNQSGRTARYHIRLALARMGEKESIDYLEVGIENITINDDFAYDVAADLVYTRQASVFKFLENQIHSNGANCSSADPDSDKKITCAYRIMEAMATSIIDFPIPIDEYGELETDDYEESLNTFRRWLKANENYKLNMEIY